MVKLVKHLDTRAGVGRALLAVGGICCMASPALAAEGLDGASLGILWAVPFIGILLSIALFPLFFNHFWEHHQGKIAAFWALLLALPLLASVGFDATLSALLHAAFLEYIPFILLLLALFTTAGGIVVRGNLHGSPLTNGALLLLGSGLASIIGTTGAAMVLIRPIIRANDNRKSNAHVIVFFIFLVANIGGSLTPLGDPPLFLGFLKGVDFFWTTTHLFKEMLFVGGIVLVVFLALDFWLYHREGVTRADPTPDSQIRITGLVNLPLIGIIIAAILLSASWKPGPAFTTAGVTVEIQNLVRDCVMVAVTLVSLAVTRKIDRSANGFSWGPMLEVAKLFASIFITIIPVLAMLKAGTAGVFAPLVALVTGPDGAPIPMAYFWLTGILSSFLDNAPTYLVFFELAGGNAQKLMTEDALTLAAISAGAVFMGANTYIGNAPNFMVYAIARQRGVRMPGFFGYMLWSGAVLIPCFILTTLIFF